MYVLGRYGIYCVALKYDEKDESFMFTTTSFAAQGFDKFHKVYIE